MSKYKRNRVKSNNVTLQDAVKDMSFAEYYDLMIAPALKFVGDEYAQKLGTAFIKWLVYHKKPRLKDEGSKLLWNCLMLAANREFNPIIADMPAYEVQETMNGKNDNF